MNRREFSALAVGAGDAMLCWPAANALAQVQAQSGTDYLTLDKPVAVEVPAGRIEVVEFFWYGCPHCNAFEPSFDAWARRVPKDVVVRRIPAAFRDEWVPHQRLFFALEALGQLDRLHAKVFHAIHAERVVLEREGAIADWVAKQGVDRAKFMDQYKSFSASTKASRAAQLQNSFRLEGVPTMAFGGRYITDGGMAGGMPQVLAVGDYLIGELRAGRL
jgi:thiol:disulfide interchange protein DsbA